MSVWDGEDRFSLLMLEEGEYYFRDYTCHHFKSNARCEQDAIGQPLTSLLGDACVVDAS